MNTLTDIDTGVATIPTPRPSVFTPVSLVSGYILNRPPDTVDTGTATNPAPLFNTVDDINGWPDVADAGY